MSDQTPTPEGTSDAGLGQATPTTPTPPANPPSSPAPPQASTINGWDDLPADVRNKLQAEHKRGLQQQLADAQRQLEQANTLRTQVSQLMESLPEGVELDDVADNVSATLESMKSEKEKLEAANRSQAEKLAAAEKLAEERLGTFHQTLKEHAFSLEAGPKAMSPAAAKLIAMHLNPISHVNENNEVVVKMDVTDENGHTEKNKEISVAEAVKLMEADVTNFGPLFKSNVNQGSGGQIGIDGVRRTDTGGIDLASLTPEQYIELQKKNPAAIEKAVNAFR